MQSSRVRTVRLLTVPCSVGVWGIFPGAVCSGAGGCLPGGEGSAHMGVSAWGGGGFCSHGCVCSGGEGGGVNLGGVYPGECVCLGASA